MGSLRNYLALGISLGLFGCGGVGHKKTTQSARAATMTASKPESKAKKAKGAGARSRRGKKSQGPTYTDPTEAAKKDSDFLTQGEYVATFAFRGEARTGVQIVALGGGAFEAVFYPGGLPGMGWVKAKGKLRLKGQSGNGSGVAFDGPNFTATISRGKGLKFQRGGQSVEATSIKRKSSTSGLKPPPGAIVLFDGSSAENFEGGMLTKDGLLMAKCTSKRTFGDQVLHLEFRTLYKPFARGQGRGNSGVYLQKKYEVQVLDSFGLEGKYNECGGIYKVAAPRVNMCYPPLTWQSYDVDFTAARFDENGQKLKNAVISVRHNGVVIHENLEIPNKTGGGGPEDPSRGPLYLQGHGNPVVYRNIWVLEK